MKRFFKPFAQNTTVLCLSLNPVMKRGAIVEARLSKHWHHATMAVQLKVYPPFIPFNKPQKDHLELDLVEQ